MLAPGFVAALLFSSFVAGDVLPQASLMSCGTVISSESIARAEDRFESLKTSKKLPAVYATGNTSISLVFHVISKNDTLEGGNIPDAQIAAQMNVLNADFASTGVSFKLTKTTRTTNATWFNNINIFEPEETDAMAALRVGGPETLNVYTVGFTTEAAIGLFGYSTFPDWYTETPKRDGVVILYSTLPGGTAAPRNLGRILTHEAGHWVGLFHTFQDGCDPGDLVDDTAPEATPARGCPVGRDTCPGDSLPDPITNFMDYTDDSCMTGFTPGQATRLRNQISVYRNL